MGILSDREDLIPLPHPSDCIYKHKQEKPYDPI